MNKTLHIDGKPVMLENVECKAGMVTFILAGKSYTFSGQRLPDGDFLLEHEVAKGVLTRELADSWQSGKERRVQLRALEARITELAANTPHAHTQSALSPVAPMPGLIRKIFVKKGDKVKQGQNLVLMEAMKLQVTLAAGGDAEVREVLVAEGDMVAEGIEMVRLVAIKAEGKA